MQQLLHIERCRTVRLRRHSHDTKCVAAAASSDQVPLDPMSRRQNHVTRTSAAQSRTEPSLSCGRSRFGRFRICRLERRAVRGRCPLLTRNAREHKVGFPCRDLRPIVQRRATSALGSGYRRTTRRSDRSLSVLTDKERDDVLSALALGGQCRPWEVSVSVISHRRTFLL